MQEQTINIQDIPILYNETPIGDSIVPIGDSIVPIGDNIVRNFIEYIPQNHYLTLGDSIISILIAALCGAIIYLVYRFFYRGLIYSENFGVLIMMVTVITAFTIVTIGSNLVLTLGMLGALSMVRFRSSIKEPIDIGFIFLSVAVGITAGSTLHELAIIGTTLICAIYILMGFLNVKKAKYLLILNYTNENDDRILKMLNRAVKKYKLKNKTLSNENIELTLEIKIKNNDTEFIKVFQASGYVSSAVIIEYNGDYV